MGASSYSILLVGCGKMGSALLTGWQYALPGARIDVIEPNPPGIQTKLVVYKVLEALPANYSPDAVVFAVKPQQLEAILPSYQARFGLKPVYISIAAGKTTELMRQYLGDRAYVVRAMPNTPALVGQGITVLTASTSLPERARHLAVTLMQAVGRVEWVDEKLMDAVTAVSGSGPAYVFLFVEALAKAGIEAGLPDAMARALALETVAGSCALARESTDSLEQLRKNVTSPGGTTEAALAVLMQDNALEMLVKNAVDAAKKRSEELS